MTCGPVPPVTAASALARSPGRSTSVYGMPNAAARCSMEAPCGVPKTRSNGPGNAAGSRPANIPPPSLFTTTTHRSGRGSPGPITRPGASCSSDRSPISANATAPGHRAVCASAAPPAVEKVPSIPLAPLLAITRTSARDDGSSRSTSRTDSELPHHSSACSGSAVTSSRATPGSDSAPCTVPLGWPAACRTVGGTGSTADGPASAAPPSRAAGQASSTAPAARVAAASARRHAPSQRPGTTAGAPVSRTAAATSVAPRCGSAHRPGPEAMTTCRTPGVPAAPARASSAD